MVNLYIARELRNYPRNFNNKFTLKIIYLVCYNLGFANSSSSHAGNLKNIFSELGEGTADDINDSR